jgi:hypothetical protein
MLQGLGQRHHLNAAAGTKEANANYSATFSGFSTILNSLSFLCSVLRLMPTFSPSRIRRLQFTREALGIANRWQHPLAKAGSKLCQFRGLGIPVSSQSVGASSVLAPTHHYEIIGASARVRLTHSTPTN